MGKKNKHSYQYPKNDKEILTKIMNPNYEGGNIGLPENASSEEIRKYRIGKEIFLQKWEKLLLDIAAIPNEELALELTKERILLDICLK